MNIEKITKIQEEIEAAQIKMQEDGEAALKEVFKEFFDANPLVSAVRWDQYTPYYCDGGPCNFYVHEFGIQFDEEDDFVQYEEELDEPTEEHTKAFSDISEIEVALGEDLLLAVFGDHVQITATEEGFDIEEAEHE